MRIYKIKFKWNKWEIKNKNKDKDQHTNNKKYSTNLNLFN
jgi:hypothetical protein